METGRLIATGVGRLSVEKSPARERDNLSGILASSTRLYKKTTSCCIYQTGLLSPTSNTIAAAAHNEKKKKKKMRRQRFPDDAPLSRESSLEG